MAWRGRERTTLGAVSSPGESGSLPCTPSGLSQGAAMQKDIFLKGTLVPSACTEPRTSPQDTGVREQVPVWALGSLPVHREGTPFYSDACVRGVCLWEGPSGGAARSSLSPCFRRDRWGPVWGPPGGQPRGPPQCWLRDPGQHWAGAGRSRGSSLSSPPESLGKFCFLRHSRRPRWGWLWPSGWKLLSGPGSSPPASLASSVKWV